MPRISVRPAIASAIAVVMAVASPLAQQSTVPPQAPQFRSRVELVAVDFLAVDGQGQPLPNLKASELTLRVDGKPREVRSLQFVRSGKPITPGLSGPATGAPSRPFADNQEADAVEPLADTPRQVVFVIDHEHIRPGNSRVLPDILNRFLDLLAPGDRAAVVTMPNGRIEVDLTPDLSRVRRAAASLSGRTPPPAGEYNLGLTDAITITRSADPRNDTIVQETAHGSCRLHRDQEYDNCMARATAAVSQQAARMTRSHEVSTHELMMSLATFLDSLATVDGPKTLVFVSEGFAPFPDTVRDLREVTTAAGRSRVQVYAIQPHVSAVQDASATRTPATYMQDLELQLSGLQDLSNATGGHLLRLTGTAETAVARIERETAAYYLLGFEPTAEERDGKSHTIDVRVQRAGVSVRARPEFTIARSAAGAAASGMPAATPGQMIRDGRTYRDLSMRALAYPFRSTDGKSVKVVVVVEPMDPATKFSSVAYALTDASGKTIEWAADASQLSARPLVSATVVPAGNYRLRVAATDSGGRPGAVDHDFSAVLVPAGAVHLGGLMLGVTTPSDSFAPKLLFGREEDVTGYFEMYGAAAEEAVVAWEVAESLTGPALATADGELSPTADADRFVANGVLPIARLAPGDYIVRARVSLNGADAARLTRAMRIAR